MSNKEIAIDIINQIPEYKLSYVVDMLNGLKGLLVDNDELNQDTVDAIDEISAMQKNNRGQHFDGSTKEFFEMMAKE